MPLYQRFLGLLLLMAHSALAQNDSTQQVLDEVTITATRAKTESLRTPYAVSTIDKKALEKAQPRATPEALQGITGVFLQKTNHGGGSPFMRGLTGNQVLVLVDGIRLNNATFRYGPNQYLNTIDAYSINRIEVARGTGSVQYGSDAIGGVLQVLTVDPAFTEQAKWSGGITGKYMTHNMEKTARGDMQYGNKKFALHAGAAMRDFGDIWGGDTTGRQSPSGYKEHSYDIKAKWLLKPNAVLTLANQWVRQAHVPVYHKVRLEDFALNEMHPQQRLLSYARLQWQSGNALFKETQFTLSSQQSKEGRNSRKNGSDVWRFEKDAVNTWGFTINTASSFNRYWTANSGIEVYHDKVSSLRQDENITNGNITNKRGLYPDAARYGNYAFYSLHRLEWNKWILHGGLRYNAFSIHIKDTSVGKVNIRPSALVANAALMYALAQNHYAYFSYSSGFRAPNVDDLGSLGIVDFRYEVPTASLQPERSSNFEAGYKFRQKKLSGAAAFYYVQLYDLITRVKQQGQVMSGYPVYQKENTEEAFIKGFETTLEWQPAKTFSLSGNLSYTFGQNTTKKEPLRRIPPLHGRLMAAWQKNKFSVHAESLFASQQNRLAQGDKEDNRIPAGGTPGWNVFNVYAGYHFSSLQLAAGLQNLLNKDYRTHGSGINGVGRSLWLAATLSL